MTVQRVDGRITTCMFAVAGALGLATTAPAQFQPDAAVSYTVGTQPSGLAPGDFDGDGDSDLASTVDNPDRIVILVNDGTGQYTPGPSSLLPSSSSPQDLVAGDLDGDGDLDLAVAVRDPVGSVIMMMNNGNGSFVAGMTVAVGDRPRGLSIRDIDNDGDMDLAVANRDSNSATVLINTGGGFSTQTLAVGGETRHTTLADFDGDGDQDLAVAVSDQTLNINQAAILINTAGTFSGPVGFNTGGSNTSDIVAADFDCDGVIDVATANTDSNNISMLRNLGGAVFGAAQLVAVQLGPDDLVAADLDGDGDPDLAAANQDSGTVSVVMNMTCAPCPWDTGGDGAVSITDLLDLLAAWGPNPGHPTDFDGNGSVDITDLLALLANWGQCS